MLDGYRIRANATAGSKTVSGSAAGRRAVGLGVLLLHRRAVLRVQDPQHESVERRLVQLRVDGAAHQVGLEDIHHPLTEVVPLLQVRHSSPHLPS